MSLLTNYEGLRHQIERLVRENEELKKLVRLIRENHELKSAIKTQAGGLGISGFTNGLGEAAAGPSQHQGVFLPPSPAAAKEPGVEDMGMVALAPLADMLNGPQLGSAAGSLINPLAAPLNPLLSGQMPLAQNSQFASLVSCPLSSHLTSPLAVSPGATLASSLGLPATGPLGSHLGGPMAVPPGTSLASSLGLTSTGSLTTNSRLAGPLAVSQSSPLMAPLAGTVAVSLSSPLLSSTATPLGVSQNILPNPINNLALSEAPRVRLAEPPRGSLSGASAGAGPATASKVTGEHPQPSQDSEPLNMMFVGAPLQTSTPMSTMATSGPTTNFYAATDTRTQTGVLQGQITLTSVPNSPTGSPACTVPNSSPTPAPQGAGNYSPSRNSPTRAHQSPTRPVPNPHSPPRNPHSPPRTSSSPASVNDTRGSRAVEQSRKSILEIERKMAHRKCNKFPDSSRDSKQLAWERLVGEIAFQLDRRILSSIFPERVRLYGFTVSNIPEKIIQASLNPSNHKLDEDLCQTLTQRYVSIMNRLQSLGYNGRVHPALTEQLVNAYGILRERPELAASEGGSYTVDFLQRVLVETVHPSMLTDALLLLSCLNQLAHDDGKPMFIW
ncbi:speriolin isoform X1 [Peromyscus maniculatus bairdii]|uniref:speriolin isoform X1 n=2 Tax=Peromyscus maniculatus bairdii TaxID=230844 RepID=UPI001C2E6795|nr:speriolin isoform X1 [Peromyscus maniculatus bairdii]